MLRFIKTSKDWKGPPKPTMAFLSSKARRNAFNDDLSRLLDPQYSPSNKYPTIIKDIHGDFHDPDYRPFTPISPPRSHSPRRISSPRPYWETISMTDDDHTNDDEDDDACDERRLSDGYAYSSRYAHRRSSGQYRRDNRYSYAHSYAHSYTPSYNPSYTTYSCSPSTLAESSSPMSYDFEATVLNEEPFNEKEKQGWSGVLRRKRKDKGKERELDQAHEDDEHVDSISPATSSPTTAPAPVPDPVVTKEEYVPTCGEVFQRHWQTFCLAFNLSIFRAQRRMKHRVHSLMCTH